MHILIVGDWVIDEHWVTGVHRSATASRKGSTHSRSLHRPMSSVQSLAAAARAASIISRAQTGKDDTSRFATHITCVGLWEPDDEDTLRRMLDPKESAGQTPFRLTRRRTDDVQVNATLINLAANEDYPCGTDRVIRIYQRSGARTELIHRIDWELPALRPGQSWPELMHIPTPEAIKSFGSRIEGQHFDALILKDMRKGVVSKDMVQFLAQRYRDIPWFISTKAWEPDWLSILNDVNVRLYLIPQIAAETALRQGHLDCWITKTGEPSGEAIAILDKLGATHSQHKERLVVVLPGGGRLLARDGSQVGDPFGAVTIGCVQENPLPKEFDSDLPMASVFFPVLAAKILASSNSISQNNRPATLENVLRSALTFTKEWIGQEGRRIKEPESWKGEVEPIFLVQDGAMQSIGEWTPFDWSEAATKWTQAFLGLGILREIKDDGSERKHIDLWRATTTLEGYACCVDAKRKAIRALAGLLGNFSRTSPGERRHQSCLLTSQPGSGKTYMVNRLAQACGFRFLPFNIAQLQGRNDLLACFQTIVSAQQEAPAAMPLLVFVDEINSELDAQPVYGMFLTPLDSGEFVRDGNIFTLAPCVWVFAGTDALDPKNSAPQSKASDFASRLSIRALSLEVSQQDEKASQLEKVYVGVSILTRIFPDVRAVSEKVLDLFSGLPPDFGIRDIEHFVRSFQDVQYGQVWSRNIPATQLDFLDGRIKERKWFDEWKNKGEGSPVEIVS